METVKRKRKALRLVMLSPDGIPIHSEDTYSTKTQAEKAFIEWKKGYERQGYYSSNNGRIELEDLRLYCKIVKLKPE